MTGDKRTPQERLVDATQALAVAKSKLVSASKADSIANDTLIAASAAATVKISMVNI